MIAKSFSIGARCILALSGLLVVVAAAAPTSAAPITWSVEDYSDGILSTTGALIGALNAATDDAANDVTVNTVPFTALTDDTANAGLIPLSGGVSVDIFGQTTGTASFGPDESVLTDNFLVSIGEETGFLTFTGLADGQLYDLQLIMGDNREHDHYNADIWGDQTDNSGDPDIFVDYGYSQSKLVTGTFNADATGTQSMYIQVIPTFPGHFNAFQLRASDFVPQDPLTLEVNTANGLATIINESLDDWDIDTYQISSNPDGVGSLDPTWNGLPGWTKGGAPDANLIADFNLTSSTVLAPEGSVLIGRVFDTAVGNQDLEFSYTSNNGAAVTGMVRYDIPDTPPLGL